MGKGSINLKAYSKHCIKMKFSINDFFSESLMETDFQ